MSPCSDCVDGHCVMNCGPAAQPGLDSGRVTRAIATLRDPHHTLKRTPNTIRDSIAEIIELQQAEIERLRALLLSINS